MEHRGSSSTAAGSNVATRVANEQQPPAKWTHWDSSQRAAIRNTRIGSTLPVAGNVDGLTGSG